MFTPRKRWQDHRTPKKAAFVLLRVDFGLVGLVVAEFETLEFSGGGFGEFAQELDPAGAFVAADAVGDKFLQFAG